jgi:hypothetical protein
VKKSTRTTIVFLVVVRKYLPGLPAKDKRKEKTKSIWARRPALEFTMEMNFLDTLFNLISHRLVA